MRRLLLPFLLLLSLCHQVLLAQPSSPADKPVVSKGSVVMAGGARIEYTAQAGYLDIRNDTGKAVARMFFTYYRKDGEDAAKRPLTIAFNGGPGSSSIWLHMGGLAPRRVCGPAGCWRCAAWVFWRPLVLGAVWCARLAGRVC